MGRSAKNNACEAQANEEASIPHQTPKAVSQEKGIVDATHPEYVLRRERLLFLYKISAPILVFYCIQAIALRLAFTLVLDAITISLFIASLRTYTSSGDLKKASWQYLIGFSVLIGLTPMVDNQVKSSVIWMLPLIPLIAAHLLGARAALVVAGGTATVMIGTWISTFWWTISPEHHFKLFDKVLLHEFSLVIAAGLALSALRNTKAQILVMRKQQEQLREAQASTQKAREAKSQFLANMSHEIRTPLNGILGITEILAQDCEESEARTTLEIAQESGNRLLHLLNGLLDLSKLEAGRLKLRKEEFSVATLLSELDRKFEQACSEHCMRLRLEHAEQDRLLSGDGKRILQVLSILLDNSIKHSQGGEIVLSIALDEEQQALQCSLSDDGIGMANAPQISSEAFSSPTQLASHDTRGGAGIGLVLASKLVELMQGELLFETAPYQGMTAKIEIPVQSHAICASEEQRPSADHLAETLVPIRVLLVDDNAVNRLVASKLLHRYDCVVQEAKDGREAVELAQLQGFDLILMDLHMPTMGGLEATCAIRNKIGPNQHTPIAALTAGEYDEGLVERQEAGMNDFLHKPLERGELERILGKYRPASELVEAQSA